MKNLIKSHLSEFLSHLTHLVKKKEKKEQDLKSFNRWFFDLHACSSIHYVYKNLHVTQVTVSIEHYTFIFGGIVKVISMISCNFSSCKLKKILKICMDVLCFVAL